MRPWARKRKVFFFGEVEQKSVWKHYGKDGIYLDPVMMGRLLTPKRRLLVHIYKNLISSLLFFFLSHRSGVLIHLPTSSLHEGTTTPSANHVSRARRTLLITLEQRGRHFPNPLEFWIAFARVTAARETGKKRSATEATHVVEDKNNKRKEAARRKLRTFAVSRSPLWKGTLGGRGVRECPTEFKKKK